MYRSSIGHVSVKYRSSMINIVSFVIDLIIVLATGQDLLAEHTGVDTGSLYGGVFAGIIIFRCGLVAETQLGNSPFHSCMLGCQALNRSEVKGDLVMIQMLLLFKCKLLCYHAN